MTILHVMTVPMSLTFLRGQVSYMKARGISVHALSSPGEDLVQFGEQEEIPVHAAMMTRRISPLRDIIALVKMRRVMHRTRPTIVHAHTPKGGLLGIVAAALSSVPIRVYQMRGLPLMTASGIKRSLLYWTEWITCRLSNVVLCNSHSMRRFVIEEGICRPSKIKVLLGGSGNGVDAEERFNPARLEPDARATTRAFLGIPLSAVVVGFVGRIVREKGIVELAAAWRLLREEYPEAHLLIVGPFETGDPVPGQEVASLQADSRAHLTGMDWNTPPLYSAMDIVALPTYREGFPNVPLEAAAMGLPVVATSVPGCVEAVRHGATGLLIPPRDSAALALALRSYLDDPDLRVKHGGAGRERVLHEFRQEALWEAILEEYRRLLVRKGLIRQPMDEVTAA
jgi:glycosyltransferase involved in cell wall biosynthesis